MFQYLGEKFRTTSKASKHCPKLLMQVLGIPASGFFCCFVSVGMVFFAAEGLLGSVVYFLQEYWRLV